MDQTTFEELVEDVKMGYFFAPLKKVWESPVLAHYFFYLWWTGGTKSTAEYVSTLIKWSEWDKSAWDALCVIAADWVREGEPLPDPLAAWTADVLRCLGTARQGKVPAYLAGPENERPRPGKGGHHQSFRDMLICEAIQELVASVRNLSPTRNRSLGDQPCAEGGSGCDIVAAALSMTYTSVEQAWARRRKRESSDRPTDSEETHGRQTPRYTTKIWGSEK